MPPLLLANLAFQQLWDVEKRPQHCLKGTMSPYRALKETLEKFTKAN